MYVCMYVSMSPAKTPLVRIECSDTCESAGDVLRDLDHKASVCVCVGGEYIDGYPFSPLFIRSDHLFVTAIGNVECDQ